METHTDTIKQTLSVIGELKSNFEIEPADSGNPLIFAGIVNSDIVQDIIPVAEKYFGQVYKPAGKSTFMTNLTDKFAKAIGGIRKEQTVFRKTVSQSLDLL